MNPRLIYSNGQIIRTIGKKSSRYVTNYDTGNKAVNDGDINATDQAIEEIAKKHLGLTTLVERFSDRLDFHDLCVGSIRDALKAAFEAGQRDALNTAKGTEVV